jgi:hypothetical protein
VALAVVKDIVERERLKLTERGYDFACGAESWRGYPFRLEFSCTAPSARIEGEERASSGDLVAAALAYNPWHVILLLDGPTDVVLAGGHRIELTHSRIVGSIEVQDSRITSSSFRITGAGAAGLFTVDGLLLHWRHQPQRSWDIALSFNKLAVHTTAADDLAIAHGEMTGYIARDRRLNVDRVELRQGNVQYWGTGHIEIDDARRIAGELSTETNDLNGLLDIIEPHLLMNDQQKTNFRLALGLLGKNAKADVLARDGVLYIGPFKAAEMLPLY